MSPREWTRRELAHHGLLMGAALCSRSPLGPITQQDDAVHQWKVGKSLIQRTILFDGNGGLRTDRLECPSLKWQFIAPQQTAVYPEPELSFRWNGQPYNGHG